MIKVEVSETSLCIRSSALCDSTKSFADIRVFAVVLHGQTQFSLKVLSIVKRAAGAESVFAASCLTLTCSPVHGHVVCRLC